MEDPDDDWLKPREKPDWRLAGKGIWTLSLSTGDKATVTPQDPGTLKAPGWVATVCKNGKTKKPRVFASHSKAIAWAEREIYGRPTAWDRLKSV